MSYAIRPRASLEQHSSLLFPSSNYNGKPFLTRADHLDFGLQQQAMADLNWKPEFSLLDGLRDSYEKDFGRGTFRKAADFSKVRAHGDADEVGAGAGSGAGLGPASARRGLKGWGPAWWVCRGAQRPSCAPSLG